MCAVPVTTIPRCLVPVVGAPSSAAALTAADAAARRRDVGTRRLLTQRGWVVPGWRACLAHVSAGLRGDAVSRRWWPALARDVSWRDLVRGGRHSLCTRQVVSGRLVPALYRCRTGRQLG